MWSKISSIGRFAYSAKIFQYYVVNLLIIQLSDASTIRPWRSAVVNNKSSFQALV